MCVSLVNSLLDKQNLKRVPQRVVSSSFSEFSCRIYIDSFIICFGDEFGSNLYLCCSYSICVFIFMLCFVTVERERKISSRSLGLIFKCVCLANIKVVSSYCTHLSCQNGVKLHISRVLT